MRTPRLDARILIVDDQDVNVRLLEQVLRKAGYSKLRGTTDSAQALPIFEEFRPDAVILDLLMPPPDGYQVLEQLRGRMPEVEVPIVVITADVTSGARQRALSLGAIDFLTKPFDHVEVLLRIANVLDVRYCHLRTRADRILLAETVRERTGGLESAQNEILDRLARLAEFRDDDTGEHTQRVGRIAAALARALQVDEREVRLIRRAAPLHDIGKVGIPDEILLRKGPLAPDERLLMQGHTRIGARILSGSPFRVLQLAETIALRHHERWDGTGYPDRLAAGSVPVAARITAVVDVWDALIHERPYKKAWPAERAAEELCGQRERQFDPEVVDAFLELLRAGSLGPTTAG
ncbi:MAG: response regulator [Deltaproteobacteria bacterium]|nr:response regulator [Deltaproteobacteria bacterium]